MGALALDMCPPKSRLGGRGLQCLWGQFSRHTSQPAVFITSGRSGGAACGMPISMGAPSVKSPCRGCHAPEHPRIGHRYPVLCGSSSRFRTAHEAAGQLHGSAGLGKLGMLSHLPAAGPGVASVPCQPLSAVPLGMTVLHVMFSGSGDSGWSPGLRTVTSSSLPRSIGQNAPQQDQPRFGSGTCPSSLNGEL